MPSLASSDSGRSFRRHHPSIARACAETLEQRQLLSAPIATPSFYYENAPQQIHFQFDQDVSASLAPADLHAESLTTDEAIGTTLAYETGNVAKFSIAGFSPAGVLPTGNYQATIFADAVQNNQGQRMADDADLLFFFMHGDATHDRHVNTNDFTVLSANLNQTGRTFSQGDFNYDGIVNVNDWTILSANYGAILPAPPLPGQLTVAQANAKNTLSWSLAGVPADIEGIRIQRSTDGQTFTTYATLAPTETSFVDDGDSDPAETGPGLAPGTRFWYRERAFGGASDGTSYTPKQGGTTVMLPPENLSAQAISPTEVMLSWTDVTSNETRFQAEITPIGGTPWTVDIAAHVGTGATSAVINGLTPNTSYTFRLRAWGPALESAYTLPVGPVTTPSELNAPSNVQITNISFSGCTVTWTDNSSDETGFAVYRSADGAPFTLAGTAGMNATSLPLTGMEEGLEYGFFVRALRGAVSADSETVYASTKLAEPDPMVSVVEQSETELLVSWSGGSSVRDGYELEVSKDGEPFELIGAFGPAQNSHVATGILPLSDYTFRVRTFRGRAYSEFVSGSGHSELPAPSSTTATVVSHREVNVTWTDNSLSETGFRITYTDLGGFPQDISTVDVGANARGYSFVNLKSSRSYSFSVAALRGTGGWVSADSNTHTVTTQSPPQPHPPLPGPYKVWVGTRTKGSTNFDSTGELTAAPHTWIQAASPEAAIPQVVSGTVTTYYPNPPPQTGFYTQTRSYPGSSFAIWWDDPATTTYEEHLPLHWDPTICAYVGVIAMEDYLDTDYNDQLWSVAVRPYGCEEQVVRLSTPDAIATEEPEQSGSQPNHASFLLENLFPDPIENLTVQFHPLAGTALRNADYRLFVGSDEIVPAADGTFSVTMPAEDGKATVELRAVDDILMEAIENTFLYPMAAATYVLQTPASAPATTQNADDNKVKEVLYTASDTNMRVQVSPDNPNQSYTSAAWLDSDGDGDANDINDHRWPIAYVRSGIPNDVFASALPTFKVAKPVQGQYKLRGRAVLSGFFGVPITTAYFPETAATLNGDLLTPNAFIHASIRIPDRLLKSDMRIVWELSAQHGGTWSQWQTVGTTSNTVYVTGRKPNLAGGKVYETVLDIGARAAGGLRPDTALSKDQILNKVWQVFETRDVHSATGKQLKYYGAGGATPVSPPPGQAVAILLANSDGRCQEWQELMLTVLNVQGVDATAVIVEPNPAWRPPITDGPPGTASMEQGFEIKPIPSQGTGGAAQTINRFTNHAIVGWTDSSGKYVLYDPSYGNRYYSTNATTKPAQDAWEAASLSKRVTRALNAAGASIGEAALPLLPVGRNVLFSDVTIPL